MNWHKKIKFNSLFFRTFLCLMASSLIMSVLFYGIVSYFTYNNIKENMYSDYEEKVGFSVQAGDKIINNVENIAVQLSNEPYIINAGIIQNADNNIDYERNKNILRILKNFGSYNDDVKNIYLYEAKNNTVYSSKEDFYNINEFSQKDIILKNTLFAGSIKLEDKGFSNVYLNSINGKVYMYINFLYSIDKPLSTIIIEINTDNLFREYKKETNDLCAVYNSNGTEILCGKDFTFNFSEKLKSAENAEWNGSFLIIPSGLTGFMYVSKYSPSLIKLNPSQIFLSVLPLILFFLLISFFVSLMVSKSIYNPIGSLVYDISVNGKDAKERLDNSKNEIEFIKNEYQNSKIKEENMENIIKKISPEILELHIKDILCGKEEKREETEKILKDTRSNFGYIGKFIVLTISFKENKNINKTILENHLNVIKETVSSYFMEITFSQTAIDFDGNIVFIAEFDPSAENKFIINHMNSIYGKLNYTAENREFEFYMGKSSVYENFNEIYYAYKDTLYDISEQKKNNNTHKLNSHINDYDLKLRHIAEEVEKGSFENAESLMEKIMQTENIDIKYNCFIELLKKFEKTAFENHMEYDLKPQIFYLSQLYENKNNSLLTQTFIKYYSDFKKGLKTALKNRQNKYIIRAKEYIELNYMSSILSLGDVAEELSINKSYLSTLFNEKLNIGFTDYVNGIRIKNAKNLLQNTEKSINDISLEVGFNTVQTFIKVFKKQVGITPGQFRKK